MTINDWLWTGFAGLAIGAAMLLVIGWNRRTRDEENHYFIHVLVCLTAMASYLMMASGGGVVHLSDGRDFYYARYVDWSITTPLLLLGLCLTALHTPFRRWALLLGILFTDFFMIVTGLFAGLSPTGSAMKWTWYLISSGAFLFLYYGLWVPLRAEAVKSGPRAAALYRADTTLLSVLWLGYPLIFLLGDEGIHGIGAVTSAAAYTVLDIVAKVVYGIVSWQGTKAKATADLAAGETPEHDLRPAPVAYHQVEAAGNSPKRGGNPPRPGTTASKPKPPRR